MNTNASRQIVNKAWNFAHVLRDDGLSYLVCMEQFSAVSAELKRGV